MKGTRQSRRRAKAEATATTTLATMVFSRRIRSEEDGSVGKGGDTHQYFVSDGLYGMMNCLLYDHASITACVTSSRAARSRASLAVRLARASRAGTGRSSPPSVDPVQRRTE